MTVCPTRTIAAVALSLLCLAASPSASRASVPTIDAAQLTRHAATASATVTLVPVTTQRKTANGGVRCAVTTGKAAPVSDPTLRPQAGAAAQAVAGYTATPATTPDPAAQGAVLASQTLQGSAGGVVAGLDASRLTLAAAQQVFRLASAQAGSAPTVMGALDLNSGIRLQNGLAWNAVVGSANLWLTALNALNLSATSDASRIAAAMRMSTTALAPVLASPSR